MIKNIIAGDTLSFSEVVPDYAPADGWVLSYDVVNDVNKYTISSTDNGDGSHLVAETAANTSLWVAGDYMWQSSVTKGAVRNHVNSGSLEIKPNFAAGVVDGRSHVKKVLDALESLIEGKAGKDVLTYSIQGRSLSRMSPDELITWHSHYKNLYRSETDAERVNQGLGTGRKILVRFA